MYTKLQSYKDNRASMINVISIFLFEKWLNIWYREPPAASINQLVLFSSHNLSRFLDIQVCWSSRKQYTSQYLIKINDEEELVKRV